MDGTAVSANSGTQHTTTIMIATVIWIGEHTASNERLTRDLHINVLFAITGMSAITHLKFEDNWLISFVSG